MPQADTGLEARLRRALLTEGATGSGARAATTPGAAAAQTAGGVQAAVLVALFERKRRLHTVLTRRRDGLRRHPGEISFPGGRRDRGDPDAAAAALREAHEEIGLAPRSVTVLGELSPTPTIVSGYTVHPIVGLIPDGMSWRLSDAEVAAVLEPALQDLRATGGLRTVVRRGLELRTETYLAGEAVIWGVTARILSDLLGRLGPLLG
ncbi:MAG TPA: CoA pyrophosphatase [Solirubrobacteraceae bacterium]|nr:CoA pyrophosphatase [Solirubrobacteraceae bacterium]